MNQDWLFGYGSLIWNPGFVHEERRLAYAPGWTRRFWQGSTDHRGVPGSPGRVVTLVPASAEQGCWGMAYRLDPAQAPAILSALDHREQGGYRRQQIEITLPESQPCLTYIAGPDNADYLGAAPLEELAAQIASATGPSGPNIEYVLKLAQALRQLGKPDEHVFQLESLLRIKIGGP